MTMNKADISAAWLNKAKSALHVISGLFAKRPFVESAVLVRVRGELFCVTQITAAHLVVDNANGGVISREVVILEGTE